MAVITAGNSPIDRANAGSAAYTKVDYNHPCSGTGTITHVRWYQSVAGSAVLGIVREVTPGVFNTIAHHALGLLGAGLQEADVSMACVEGDLLAVYTSGNMDWDSGGNIGSYAANGDKLTGDMQNWSTQQLANWEYSMDATGETGALPSPADDSCEGISAWLDAIEAQYVPCVDTWLAAN